MAEAIDYGAHAPASSGPIDYGAHSSASTDEAPGFFSTIGSDALSLLHAVRHPVQAAAAMANSSVEHGAKAIEGIKEGDARKVYDNAYQAVPGIGPMLWGIAQDLVAGNHGRAAARLAELAVPEVAGEYGPKIAETVSKIPGAVKDIAQTPGTAQIAGGAAGIAGGIGAAASGHVLEGGAAAAYGAKKLSEGLELRGAAKTAMQEAQDILARRAAQDARVGVPRTNPPVWAQSPDLIPQPVADLDPIPSELPSGRIPGPAPAPQPVNNGTRPAPVWQQIPDQPQDVIPDAQPIVPADRVLPSGRRVPVPGQEPNPITSALDRAKLTVDARETAPPPTETAPLTAAQEIAQKFAGPSSDVQTLADQYHARGDVPSPRAAAAKDLKLAEHLRGKGVTGDVFEQAATASRTQAKSWSADAGISELSKDPKRIADVANLLRKDPPTSGMQAATEAEIMKNVQNDLGAAEPAVPAKKGTVLFMPSPELQKALTKPGATKAAAALAKKLE